MVKIPFEMIVDVGVLYALIMLQSDSSRGTFQFIERPELGG